jgi:DNA-binding transcriptional ArsR family regulator
MTEVSYKEFFATLSGDKRLEILQYLKDSGAKNVSEIAEGTEQEQSAVSHSLKRLLSCQCVHVEIRGKNRVYSLNSETIIPILKLVDQHIQSYCKEQCQHCAVTKN